MTISNHIYFRLDMKIFRIFLFEPCHYLLSYIYVKRYLLFFVYIKHAMIKITIWLIYSQSHFFFDILIVELFFTMEMNTYIKKEIKMWTWEISFFIFQKIRFETGSNNNKYTEKEDILKPQMNSHIFHGCKNKHFIHALGTVIRLP